MLDLLWQACGIIPLCERVFPGTTAQAASYFSVTFPLQLFWYGLIFGTFIGCMGSTLLKSFVLPMFLVEIALLGAAVYILWYI